MKKYDWIQYDPVPPAPLLAPCDDEPIFVPRHPGFPAWPITFVVHEGGLFDFAPESLPRTAAALLMVDERDLATPLAMGLLMVRFPTIMRTALFQMAIDDWPGREVLMVDYSEESQRAIYSDVHAWLATLTPPQFAAVQDELREMLGGPPMPFAQHLMRAEVRYKGASQYCAPLYFMAVVDPRISREIGLQFVNGADAAGEDAWAFVLRRSPEAATAIAAELSVPFRFVRA